MKLQLQLSVRKLNNNNLHNAKGVKGVTIFLLHMIMSFKEKHISSELVPTSD